jgi:membrane associated rhomboid family serine protease
MACQICDAPRLPASCTPIILSFRIMGRYWGSDEDHDHQPLTWVGGYGIFAAHFIVIAYVVSMVVTAILGPASPLYDWLAFSNARVLRGEIWRVFTYGLVNPPSIQFALDMVMIVWFGREVEKFYGRKKFLGLFIGIYLLPNLVLTALTPWLPAFRYGEFGALALFVAFAALYPQVPLMFNILAQWAAIILVGIFSLMAIMARDWATLLATWTASGFAYAFVRHQQNRLTLPRIRLWDRRPKLRVVPDLPEREKRAAIPVTVTPVDDSMAEIDALLDKIARSGLHSLTPRERAKLEKGRETLLKKESGRR